MWNEMHGISYGYKLDWCDCVILACETNEMVGIKVAWDEIPQLWFENNGLVWIHWENERGGL